MNFTLVDVNQDLTYEGPFISVDQDIYTTSIAAKYLDTTTESAKFYRTTFPYDMIFTKYDASNSD